MSLERENLVARVSCFGGKCAGSNADIYFRKFPKASEHLLPNTKGNFTTVHHQRSHRAALPHVLRM
jgi:hypothetical protein